MTIPVRSARVLIVGVGNTDRGDDALGIVAARRISTLVPPQVKVVECTGDLSDLLELWKESDMVLVLDAMSSGAKPGTILRVEVGNRPLRGAFDSWSTHGLRLREAIELCRVLGTLPRRMIVYGVEASNYRIGEGLSPVVEASLATLQKEILREVSNARDRSCQGDRRARAG